MGKTSAVIAIILIVPLTTAVEYEVFLFNDEPEEKFHMDGWITSSGENIDASLFYNLTFHETNYNSTRIDNFTVILADGEKRIASNSKKIGKLKENSSKSGFISIESRKNRDRVDQVKFLLEHEATAFQGYKVKETVQGFFDYEITAVHPEIESLKTGSPTVRRGENITVTARTSSINSLKTGNTNFSQVEDNLFRANLTVPRAETGSSPVYKLEDGRGNVFRQGLNATTVNTPPDIELKYNSHVTGDKTAVRIKNSDDTGINRTYVTFRGRRYYGEKVNLLTNNIPSGTHVFTAVAIDEDGANTTEKGTLKIPGNTEDVSKKQEDKDSKEMKNGPSSEEKGEKEEPLFQPIIDFFKSFI